MIIVIGSRHDPVANELATSLTRGVLCSAEDLTAPGWRFSPTRSGGVWVVDGQLVNDDEVTGVFVRRPTIYPEELVTTHPDDRAYMASETHAFVVFVLAATGAIVANPVGSGSMGEELFRPERWMAAASYIGQPVAPIRLTHGPPRRRRFSPMAIEVVGDEVIGDMADRTKERVFDLAKRIGILWGTFVFDGRHRLVTITGNQRPTEPAVRALDRLLSERAA